MKKIIFASFLLIGFHLPAQEWEPYWVEAIKECHARNYASAESFFNETIAWMELENDLEYPSVYTDRARFYMALNRYEEALADVNKALLSEKLQHDERIKAVNLRIVARLKLGFSDGYEEDLRFLFKHVKMPFKETDNHCPICALNIYKQTTRIDITAGACRLWCDENARTAIIGWCAFFPDFCVINACNKAVLEIQSNCRACCDVFFNKELCAAPFADIVSVMQKYLPACGCPREGF